MTEAQAEEAVLQHWKAEWESLHAGLSPVETPPAWIPEAEIGESVAEYLRITMAPTVRRNRSLGGERKEQRGVVAFQIFTRPSSGTFRINTLADRVRSVMENQSIYVAGVAEPLCTYTGGSERGSSDGAWQMKIVTIDFVYLDA